MEGGGAHAGQRALHTCTSRHAYAAMFGSFNQFYVGEGLGGIAIKTKQTCRFRVYQGPGVRGSFSARQYIVCFFPS